MQQGTCRAGFGAAHTVIDNWLSCDILTVRYYIFEEMKPATPPKVSTARLARQHGLASPARQTVTCRATILHALNQPYIEAVASDVALSRRGALMVGLAPFLASIVLPGTRARADIELSFQ